MLLVDILLIVALLGFVGAGMKDGFVHTFGRLVGAIIGFVAARAWSVYLVGIFGLFMPSGVARLVAFIVIFVLITRLVGFVFTLIDGVFKIVSILPFLKSINSLLGAILGLFEGVILVGGAIYLILTFALEPNLVHWLTVSSIAPWIVKVFQTLLGILL